MAMSKRAHRLRPARLGELPGVGPRPERRPALHRRVLAPQQAVPRSPRRRRFPYRPAEAQSRLMSAAEPVLNRFAMSLPGTDVCIVLADRGARIVGRWVGDRSLERRLTASSIDRGFVLDEEVAGTNGIGTVLEEMRPIEVVGPEHYVSALQTLTCVGVPIRHPLSGRLEGVLDLACPTADANSLLLPDRDRPGCADRTRAVRTGLRLRAFGAAGLRRPQPGDHAAADRAHRPVHDGQRVGVAVARRRRPGLPARTGRHGVAVVRRGRPRDGLLAGPHGRRPLPTRPGRAQDRRPAHRDRVRAPTPRRRSRSCGGGRNASWSGPGRGGAGRGERLVAAGRANGCAQLVPTSPVRIEGEAGTGKMALARHLHQSMRPGSTCTVAARHAGGASSVPRSGCAAPWRHPARPGSAGPSTLVLPPRRLAERAGGRRARATCSTSSRTPRRWSSPRSSPATRSVPGPLDDRLRTQVVTLPPLRGRPEDIAGIADALIRRHASGRHRPRIVPNALRLLMRHPWPGNVRELEALMIRLLADGRCHDITPMDLAELGVGVARSGAPSGTWRPSSATRSSERCATRTRTRRAPPSRSGCPVPPSTGRSATTASTPSASCSDRLSAYQNRTVMPHAAAALPSEHEPPSDVARDQIRVRRVAGAHDPHRGPAARCSSSSGQGGHRRRRLRRRAPPAGRGVRPEVPACLGAPGRSPRRAGTSARPGRVLRRADPLRRPTTTSQTRWRWSPPSPAVPTVLLRPDRSVLAAGEPRRPDRKANHRPAVAARGAGRPTARRSTGRSPSVAGTHRLGVLAFQRAGPGPDRACIWRIVHDLLALALLGRDAATAAPRPPSCRPRCSPACPTSDRTAGTAAPDEPGRLPACRHLARSPDARLAAGRCAPACTSAIGEQPMLATVAALASRTGSSACTHSRPTPSPRATRRHGNDVLAATSPLRCRVAVGTPELVAAPDLRESYRTARWLADLQASPTPGLRRRRRRRGRRAGRRRQARSAPDGVRGWATSSGACSATWWTTRASAARWSTRCTPTWSAAAARPRPPGCCT